MIKPTSDDPAELIRLAVRMGIPPAEAARRVMDHLTRQPVSNAIADDALVEPRPAPETRSRARVRLIHGGRGREAGRVSAPRVADPSPTTESSASV